MLIVVFVMLASEGAAIQAGRKMECIELINFHFCRAFTFCQQINKVEFFGVFRANRQHRQRHFKTSSTGDENSKKTEGGVVRSAKKKVIFPDQVVINFKTLDTYRREGLRLIDYEE